MEGERQPIDRLQALHAIHHFGVKRMMFLARKLWGPGRITEKQVQAVVKGCLQCASIDPSPVKWEKGELGVKETWKRLAMDVTHTSEGKYMTLVDCGPGRFSVWRRIASECDGDLCAALKAVFNEFGPPQELLLDNFPTRRKAAI